MNTVHRPMVGFSTVSRLSTVRIRIRVSVGIRVSLVSVVRIFRRPTRLWLCRKAVKFVSGERISLQYIYEHMPRLQAAARGKKTVPLPAAHSFHFRRFIVIIIIITLCVSRRRRKMYCGHASLCVCVSVCLCVCPRLHAHITARTRM